MHIVLMYIVLIRLKVLCQSDFIFSYYSFYFMRYCSTMANVLFFFLINPFSFCRPFYFFHSSLSLYIPAKFLLVRFAYFIYFFLFLQPQFYLWFSFSVQNLLKQTCAVARCWCKYSTLSVYNNQTLRVCSVTWWLFEG